MPKRRWILWQSLIAPGMERFIIEAVTDGFELSGMILQAHDDALYVARYMIRVDPGWRTRRVTIELENDGERSLSLSADGGWSGESGPIGELDGCIDIDLEWTPSTNTLPLRRLGLAIGERKDVTAGWIRFPSLELQRLEQSYERLDQRRYRYRSGRFTADLEVDDDGIVLQYGVNWKAVASSGDVWATAPSTSARPAAETDPQPAG